MQTLVWLTLMSALRYYGLCSILLVSFHYKCLSGMWARFQARETEIDNFMVSQNNFPGLMIYHHLCNRRRWGSWGCGWGNHLGESSHERKETTPVAKLKYLPSFSNGGPRFHPTDRVARGRWRGDFLDTLRPKVNRVMTHFTADCRILQSQGTHMRCLQQDVRHCYYWLETKPFAGRQRRHVLTATLWAPKAWRWVSLSSWQLRSLSSFEQRFWISAISICV